LSARARESLTPYRRLVVIDWGFPGLASPILIRIGPLMVAHIENQTSAGNVMQLA
jgi:hypothetical protein